MLSQPHWVNFGSADRRQLRFRWDDARVDDDFTGDASVVLSAALKMSVRARMALAVALSEWVVWRFEGLHARDEPRQVLEAAWCATVDPRYLAFFDVPREEWVGPVEGPLWCAMAYLQHGLPKGYELEGDLYDAMELLYLLAVHVVPEPEALERWLGPTLQRLVATYPVSLSDDDGLQDLFDHHIGERLGTLLGRDTLDPTLPIDLARDRRFLTQVLTDASATENPFLATPDDLEDEEFQGEPYVLPGEST
jgi:hypothetical protein